MKSYSEISNRYMKENKKRTALTIVGITLATILIFAIGTFLLSFRDSMIEQLRAKGDFEFIITGGNGEQVKKIIDNAEIKNYAIDGDIKSFTMEKGGAGVKLTYCDDGYYERIMGKSLDEGRAPQNENEVVLDKNRKSILNIKINDKLDLIDEFGEKKEVTIVGFKSGGVYSTKEEIPMYGYLNKDNLNVNGDYSAFVNLNSEKNKQEIVDKVMDNAGIEINGNTKQQNNELLYLTGNGASKGINRALTNMAIFVIVVIIICTITVIYNSFNISVIERIRYFGILKAIGATSKQIKRIIYREGFMMGLIALPIGCIIGYIGLKYGIQLFIGDTLLVLEHFKIGFYPEIILIAAVLEFLTIWISLLAPARKAKKVSAVEAMRNQKEIKLGKIKNRKNRITQKLFGIEGSLAYKNIRRTPFRFFVTVLALTISITMFNVFYGFLDVAKEATNQMYMNIAFDSTAAKTDKSTFANNELDEIESNVKAEVSYEIYEQDSNLYIPTKDLNADFISKSGINPGMADLDDVGYRSLYGSPTYVGDMNFLNINKDNVTDGSIDETKLKDGGIILIDGMSITNSDGNKEIIRTTNYKAGDTIKIPKLKDYNVLDSESQSDKARTAINNNEFVEVPIVAIVNKDVLTGTFLNGRVEILAYKDGYTKNFKEFAPNIIAFKFGDNEDNREQAINYFAKIKDSTGYAYQDLGQQVNEINKVYVQVEFFVYCFIIIITIISVVNIFNTISTNLLLRKKEFSTLKAIGMKESQLKKSVILEGTLYGILAAIFGGILSAVLLAILIKMGGGLADIDYQFDYIAFIASLLVGIGVTYISTLIPLQRLKKLTIIEGIRDDE